MKPEHERLANMALARLESGEEIALMIGDGPRPMAVPLTTLRQAEIRRVIIHDLIAALALNEPTPPSPTAPSEALFPAAVSDQARTA